MIEKVSTSMAQNLEVLNEVISTYFLNSYKENDEDADEVKTSSRG
jgi:hypothetical protein